MMYTVYSLKKVLILQYRKLLRSRLTFFLYLSARSIHLSFPVKFC